MLQKYSDHGDSKKQLQLIIKERDELLLELDWFWNQQDIESQVQQLTQENQSLIQRNQQLQE